MWTSLFNSSFDPARRLRTSVNSNQRPAVIKGLWREFTCSYGLESGKRSTLPSRLQVRRYKLPLLPPSWCTSDTPGAALVPVETQRTGAASSLDIQIGISAINPLIFFFFQMVHEGQVVTQPLLKVWAKGGDLWPQWAGFQRSETDLMTLASDVSLVESEVIFFILKPTHFYISF